MVRKALSAWMPKTSPAEAPRFPRLKTPDGIELHYDGHAWRDRDGCAYTPSELWGVPNVGPPEPRYARRGPKERD